MKIAITSDWQMTEHNLHLCRKFFDQMLTYCIKNKVKVLAHLGDLKHQYSPVDVRVYNESIRMVKEAQDAGISWVQVAGNHDRISMHDVSGYWFPALRAAGARIITKPTVLETRSVRLAVVPYLSDPLALKNAFKRVSTLANGNADLLFFHCSIYGCRSNVLTKLKEGVAIDDLKSNGYKFCIGGHIHLPQAIGKNIMFVGSPFSQDWGESNQAKRFVVFDSTSGKLDSVPAEMPGMFDTSWPGFKDVSPNDWKGHKVRVHIACDGAVKDLQKLLLKTKTHAEETYAGAAITIVPEFAEVENGVTKTISTTDDESALKDFINAVCPPYLSNQKKRLISYLTHILASKGFIRRSVERVKILSAEGRNVLCFKKVKIDFKHKGIIVVTGANLDWKKRSNGAGKTSLMALPTVALAGKTLKGQANEKWVRRGSTGLAFAKLRLILADGRKCTVSRCRRPTRLKVLVDDHDQSVGIGVRGTQQRIELLTGLTYETLRNAIYIDQTEVNAILKGTDTDRKGVFSKLLNLERFEHGRELLKEELRRLSRYKEDTESKISSLKTEIRSLKDMVTDTDYRTEFNSAKSKARHWLHRVQKLKRRIKNAERDDRRKYKSLGKIKEKTSIQLADLMTTRETLLEVRGAYKKDIEGFEIVAETKCPTCKQEISSKFRRERNRALKHGLKIIEKKIKRISSEALPLTHTLDELNDSLRSLNSAAPLEQELIAARKDRRIAERDLERLQEQEQLRTKYTVRLRKAKKYLDIQERALKAYEEDQSFVAYGVKVFSKDGLPAYMIKVLVPQLNLAAEKYSRMIAENEIKVKFVTADDGAIDIDINNEHGGANLEDQSQGETRIASIITSFAIRIVINPANLLILDEPGEGLDSHNARLFATVLKEIAKKFGTVMLTTHNPVILAELEGERTIRVEKKNKIARLVA